MNKYHKYYKDSKSSQNNRTPSQTNKKSEGNPNPTKYNSSNTPEGGFFQCGQLGHYKSDCPDLTQEEHDVLHAKRNHKLKEWMDAMIAEEASKKEAHLSDTSSEEDYIADVDDEEEDEVILVEQTNLADEVDDDDDEEYCMGLENKIEETKVDSQLTSSIISNDENAVRIHSRWCLERSSINK